MAVITQEQLNKMIQEQNSKAALSALNTANLFSSPQYRGGGDNNQQAVANFLNALSFARDMRNSKDSQRQYETNPSPYKNSGSTGTGLTTDTLPPLTGTEPDLKNYTLYDQLGNALGYSGDESNAISVGGSNPLPASAPRELSVSGGNIPETQYDYTSPATNNSAITYSGGKIASPSTDSNKFVQALQDLGYSNNAQPQQDPVAQSNPAQQGQSALGQQASTMATQAAQQALGANSSSLKNTQMVTGTSPNVQTPTESINGNSVGVPQDSVISANGNPIQQATSQSPERSLMTREEYFNKLRESGVNNPATMNYLYTQHVMPLEVASHEKKLRDAFQVYMDPNSPVEQKQQAKMTIALETNNPFLWEDRDMAKQKFQADMNYKQSQAYRNNNYVAGGNSRGGNGGLASAFMAREGQDGTLNGDGSTADCIGQIGDTIRAMGYDWTPSRVTTDNIAFAKEHNLWDEGANNPNVGDIVIGDAGTGDIDGHAAVYVGNGQWTYVAGSNGNKITTTGNPFSAVRGIIRTGSLGGGRGTRNSGVPRSVGSTKMKNTKSGNEITEETFRKAAIDYGTSTKINPDEPNKKARETLRSAIVSYAKNGATAKDIYNYLSSFDNNLGEEEIESLINEAHSILNGKLNTGIESPPPAPAQSPTPSTQSPETTKSLDRNIGGPSTGGSHWYDNTQQTDRGASDTTPIGNVSIGDWFGKKFEELKEYNGNIGK